MEEKEVSAEEMTEEELGEFEDAFSQADSVEEAESSLEGGQGSAEEETYADGPEEEEIQGDKKEPQTIVVNGKEYTQEEIAQKLSEPPQRYGVLERLAGEAGMGLDEYLENVDQRYTAGQVENRTAQLTEQGLDEGFARHVAQVEMENAKMKTGGELSRQDEARMKAEIEEFNSVYPDVREIPPEVLSEISKTGHSPVVAYQNHLLKEKEAELKALKQAKRNKETTPGPARGTQAGRRDEFGEAFMAAMND